MELTLKSIAYGKAQEYTLGEKVFQSAYKKDQFIHSVQVNEYGLLHDEQVEKQFHGGLDKAIHFGSYTHLENNPSFDKLFIGCNILVQDVDETDIYLGDIYRIGKVRIEVCQPRLPCWKIGALFGKEASRYIKQNHATGWYVRILNTGHIDLNNTMVLEKRVSALSITDLSMYINTPPSNRAIIDEIIQSPIIAQSYKEDFLGALQHNNA